MSTKPSDPTFICQTAWRIDSGVSVQTIPGPTWVPSRSATIDSAGSCNGPAPADLSQDIRVSIASSMELLGKSLMIITEQQSGLKSCAFTQDEESTIRRAKGHKPDVLVIDTPGIIRRQNLHLFYQKLQEVSPETRIVMLIEKEDVQVVQVAMALGIENYALKQNSQEDLLIAIQTAHQGVPHLDQSIAFRVFHNGRKVNQSGLTQKEEELLRLAAWGHTNQEIGAMLHISPRTVEAHRSSLRDKLEIQSRPELVREALRRGLLRVES